MQLSFGEHSKVNSHNVKNKNRHHLYDVDVVVWAVWSLHVSKDYHKQKGFLQNEKSATNLHRLKKKPGYEQPKKIARKSLQQQEENLQLWHTRIWTN